MKIAITGAHSVGKTTLAERLKESLSGYTLLQEPYHELETQGYFFAEAPGTEDFLAQLHYSLNQVTTTAGAVIFDRCPLDLLAYLQVLKNSSLVAEWYEAVQQAMATIDLLVFVPVENPDRTGCAADALPKLRTLVNETIETWLPDFDIPLVEVSGTLAERERQVLQEVARRV